MIDTTSMVYAYYDALVGEVAATSYCELDKINVI